MRQNLFMSLAVAFNLLIGQFALANKNCAGLPLELVEHWIQKAPTSVGQNQILFQEQSLKTLIQDYSQRLGLFQDPFAMAFSPGQGERIFQRLSVRARGEKWIHSPLAIINFSLNRVHTLQKGYNEKLIQWMIDDASYWVKSSEVERTDLQSILLALKYAVDYVRRYKEPDTIAHDDSEKVAVPFEQADEQKQLRLAEVNFEAHFFAQRYFPKIVRGAKHPFQEVVLPTIQTIPGEYQQTGLELVVGMFGNRKVALPLPPLYRPLQPSDPRTVISRSETGGYILETNELLEDIRIPLTRDANINMMPSLREVYTRSVGFKTEEWPDRVQTEVIGKYTLADAKTHPLVVAQAITHHIATEYLYSVSPRPETDPVNALKAGAFQSEMAAYAMIGLLRDVYKIPSRVGKGLRTTIQHSDEKGNSYLEGSAEAHFWVEVFVDGQWHLFNPTPVRGDQNDKRNGDSFYPHSTLNDPRNLDQNEKGGLSPSQPSTSNQSSNSEKLDNRQHLDQPTPSGTRVLLVETTKLPHNDNKVAPSPTEKMPKTKVNQPTKVDMVDQLALGSLELEPRFESNILLERALRVLLQIALDPTKSGTAIQNKLNLISSLLGRYNTPQLKLIFQKALSAHQVEHPGIKDWVDQLARLLPGQDINKSYHDLHRILIALETYSNVLDPEGRITKPDRLIGILDEVKRRISTLAHPDSQDIGLVLDLVKNLPSVARLLLKNQFDLSLVGPNSPTKTVAQQLKTGSLNDLRLMSILSPLSDFILNSTPRPESIEVRTWQRDTARPWGRDLLLLQRFSDLSRAFFAQPGKSPEENIQDGTAFVLTRRQRVQIPQGYGKEESERITIVMYDTSSSMADDPGRFQAGLIAAFTGNALSDISPSGRHRHRVLIVPFDTSPGTAIHVTNTQEALDLIRNYPQKLKNTGGSTDIQKALLQAMKLIADAQKQSRESLAAANIVLMTDGQSEINSEALLQARIAIHRQTPLQTMFISINQSNEELMRFAMDSQKMGAERGFYREYTSDHIKSILHEADTLNLNGRNDFYTDKAAIEMPAEIFSLMDQALGLAGELSDQIFVSSQFVSAREHLANFEKIKWSYEKHSARPLEKWLIKVRQLARHPIFKDRRILERVVDDLVTHIDRLSGVKTHELSGHEQEQLRHLLRSAAGLEEGAR